MSRAINLRMTMDDVARRCAKANISISAIETLPSGDTHLVCTTSDGANAIRRECADYVVEGKQKRFPTYVPPSRW